MPEVALEYPDALKNLHIDFQRAGSDIVEAFTYNGHGKNACIEDVDSLIDDLESALSRVC